jgi:hypothetical protein
MRMQQSKFLLAEFPKSSGQNGTSQTGYETWICGLGKKSFVNLDIVVNKRQVPPNQKSKLNHARKGYAPLKVGNLDCLFLVWTRPKQQLID